jgi:hypothetical protein
MAYLLRRGRSPPVHRLLPGRRCGAVSTRPRLRSEVAGWGTAYGLLSHQQTTVLNNKLEGVFRGWCPLFRVQDRATCPPGLLLLSPAGLVWPPGMRSVLQVCAGPIIPLANSAGAKYRARHPPGESKVSFIETVPSSPQYMDWYYRAKVLRSL